MKIKIWKENNNDYENIKVLTHSNKICSILYLEDKNILISCGLDGTRFWNLNKNESNYNNINCIQYFEKVDCGAKNGLCRLDEDRIIVGRDSLKIISILNKKIIKEINIPFKCFGIRLIEDKGIFLIGGKSKDIRIYRSDNYECIQIIQNAHYDDILGFVGLKDGSILSYSVDKKIKIWE
jgi:WD40 repeat protein